MFYGLSFCKYHNHEQGHKNKLNSRSHSLTQKKTMNGRFIQESSGRLCLFVQRHNRSDAQNLAPCLTISNWPL